MTMNSCYLKDVLLLLLQFVLVTQVHTKISGPPRLSASGYQMQHISKAGENIKLHCPLEPNFQPPPLVSWNKDDESIHVGWNRIKTLDNDKVLRIKDLEVTDSGVYVCKATNGFGSVEAKHLLYVHANDTTPPGPSFNENIFENIPGKEIRPKFLHSSKMEPYIVAPSGGTVYLPCEATGRPKPEILWYRESRQLFQEDLNGLAGEVVQDQVWKLKISAVKDRHAGKYTCKLFNSVGSLNFTFTVHVAASNADEEPLFVEGHLKNTTAYYGHPANFECVVRSTSVPLLQWLKPVPASSETKFLSSASTNNTVILNNQRYLILQGTLLSKEDVYSNTLSIASVHQYDYGMYICSVASNQGLLHRSVFLLPHSDESSIQNEAQVISPGYYFIFGIIVSLSVTLLIIFVTVIICCRRTASFKQKDISVSNQPAIPNRPCSRNQQISTPHQTPVFPETSVQGSWQHPTYFPPMDEPTPTAEVTSNIQIYYQANGPHNFPTQDDNQAVLKAHHYSLISGSTASHQTPPSMVSSSSSQKQFFYRPPFRQQQPPLLGGNHTLKD